MAFEPIGRPSGVSTDVTDLINSMVGVAYDGELEEERVPDETNGRKNGSVPLRVLYYYSEPPRAHSEASQVRTPPLPSFAFFALAVVCCRNSPMGS